MRGRDSAAIGVDALHRPDGPGGRLGLVPGRGVRGRGAAGLGRPLRRRDPCHRPPSRHRAVPPHRRRAGTARRRGGPVLGRAGPPPSRLRPLAAHPHGALGRPGPGLPAGRRPLPTGLSHPVPLVPGRAPGRRHRASRRPHRGHRAAGAHLRPVPLRQLDVEAARRAAPRRRPGPDARPGAAQARPPDAGRLPRPGVPRRRERGGGRGARRSRVEPGARRPSTTPSACAAPSTAWLPAASFPRSRNCSGSRSPPRSGPSTSCPTDPGSA